MDNLPESQWCSEHNKMAKLKVHPTFGAQYSHSITWDPQTRTGEWCNKKPEDFGREGHAPASGQIKREKVEEPDWDEIARGKVRCQIAVAFIGKGAEGDLGGPEYKSLVREMEWWVDYVMDGPPKD